MIKSILLSVVLPSYVCYLFRNRNQLRSSEPALLTITNHILWLSSDVFDVFSSQLMPSAFSRLSIGL